MKIVSATGHRPDKLGGYGDDVFDRLSRFAFSVLDKYESDTAIISGMALGWDQAVSKAALGHGMRLIAAVPFKGQESRWPLPSQARYQDLLAQASKVVVVCDGSYSAWKMHERNKWMVDRASEVLALWNGTDGGTKNCVDYAVKKDKTILNVWDDWQKWQG